MKLPINILVIFATAIFAAGQIESRRYEVELIANPNPGGRDTREVNAVIIFEKDAVRIISRRNRQTFKLIKYAEIESVTHSYSKGPLANGNAASVVAALLVGPWWLIREDKHWLTIVAGDEFAVLKIENDNFRMLIPEFQIRGFDVTNVNEDK
jgi:hypothetical protein